ncbi:Uncharacterized protein Rs2_12678 [Raphanus sativus]|nr:Uncharacterized protein Rs2_12678 [Raphanus sativus]
MEQRRVRRKVSVERERSVSSSSVFSGWWRLLQIHKRRFKLPGRRSPSDLFSPALVFGVRRLLQIRAAAQEPGLVSLRLGGRSHSGRREISGKMTNPWKRCWLLGVRVKGFKCYKVDEDIEVSIDLIGVMTAR